MQGCEKTRCSWIWQKSHEPQIVYTIYQSTRLYLFAMNVKRMTMTQNLLIDSFYS